MRWSRRRSLARLLGAALLASGCREGGFIKQYEYEEDLHLSTDGSVVLYVNSSIPALVALRGADLDPDPRARFDRARIRQFFEGDGVRMTRLSGSRRSGRRFLHVRLEASDVRTLGTLRPFAWSSYEFERAGEQIRYRQRVSAPERGDPGRPNWRGDELAAFRLHLPSRIQFHNAPTRRVERGNILTWEQTLAERMKGAPIDIEVRMDPASILYRTLTLFAAMIALALSAMALVVWRIARAGRRAADRAA
jgi:hypothetical protein